MSPSVISIIRLTIRIAVVLPQPEGPTRTQISPAGTSNDRWSTASRWAPAYRFTTSRNSSVAACGKADGPSDWAVFGLFTEAKPQGWGSADPNYSPCRPLPLGEAAARLVQPFDDHGESLAAGHAHGLQADLLVVGLHDV